MHVYRSSAWIREKMMKAIIRKIILKNKYTKKIGMFFALFLFIYSILLFAVTGFIRKIFRRRHI